jgi:hypothetical protein
VDDPVARSVGAVRYCLPHIVEHPLLGGRAGHGDASEMLDAVLSRRQRRAERDALGDVPDHRQSVCCGRLGERQVRPLAQHRVGLHRRPALVRDLRDDRAGLLRRVGKKHPGPGTWRGIDPGARQDQARPEHRARLDPRLQVLLLPDRPERAHVADAGDPVDEIKRQRRVGLVRRREDVDV